MKLAILPLALAMGLAAAAPSPLPRLAIEQRQDAALADDTTIDTTPIDAAFDSLGNPLLARALTRAAADVNLKRQEWNLDDIEQCFTDCLTAGRKQEACICTCVYAGNCDGGPPKPASVPAPPAPPAPKPPKMA